MGQRREGCLSEKTTQHLFIPYYDDELRDQFVFVVATNNERELYSLTNTPGENEKIQQRFISAPGVSLNINPANYMTP